MCLDWVYNVLNARLCKILKCIYLPCYIAWRRHFQRVCLSNHQHYNLLCCCSEIQNNKNTLRIKHYIPLQPLKAILYLINRKCTHKQIQVEQCKRAWGDFINNPRCTNWTLCMVYCSTIGQLSYLGKISVFGHFNEMAT